jgi:small subunit ribosomal protein S13
MTIKKTIFVLQTNIPAEKRLDISLLSCFGISHTSSLRASSKLGLNFGLKKSKDHSLKFIKKEWFIPEMIRRLNIVHTMRLRFNLYNNVKKIKSLKIYRGFRHSLFLPVRGQRTKKNARTQKNKRPNRKKVVISKKKKK